MSRLPKLIVILGPTAVGKTALAVKLASKFNGEIVSADSRQVYKGMDIGTGKDLNEYKVSILSSRPSLLSSRPSLLSSRPSLLSSRPSLLSSRPSLLSSRRKPGSRNKKNWIPDQVRNDNFFIPCHLINIIKPNTDFNVAKYKKLALRAIKDILARGKIPFLVGGTGLYISAIVDNYGIPKVGPDKKIRESLKPLNPLKKVQMLKKLDPDALNFVDVNNPRRLDRALEVCLSGQKFSKTRNKGKPLFNVLQIGLTFPKKVLDKRIDERVNKMIKNRLVDEVKRLIKNYPMLAPGYTWSRDVASSQHGSMYNMEPTPLQTIGYKEIINHLDKKITLDKAIELIKIHTHQFAKRQMTWFKRDRRIRWIKDKSEAEKLIKSFLLL